MPEKKPVSSHYRLWVAFQVLVCTALLAPLVFFAWEGTFMRYSGDDYCYASAMVDHGLIGNQVESYFHVANYNGNRYSLTLFSNLADLLGALSGAIMPGLAIVLWVLGTFLLLRELSKLLNVKTSGWVKLQMAAFLVFICLYQAPVLLQDLFWRTAMLTYLAPVICLTWLIGLLLVYINSKRSITALLPVICLFAFLSAGFSETGAALQASVMMFGAVGFGLARKMDLDQRRRTLMAFGVALFGTLTAMLVLAFSPSNADRIGDYPHPDLLHLITLSLSYALTFIIESIKSYPLPTLVTLAFNAILALIVLAGESNKKIKPIKWLIASCLIVLVCLGLVVATAAPSVLARSAYPEQRAWMPGRFTITVGLVALGLLFGVFFHQVVNTTLLKQIIILVVMLATAVYALRTVPRILRDAGSLRSWATSWDVRDRYIRAEVEAGDQNIIVNSLPTIIPYVSELHEDPGYWYNLCAAGWYGLDSISAVNNP
jgi:hypothetical protein